MVELTAAIAEAATLTGTLVVGGADAVHLASALTLVDADPILISWDIRLRTAAMEAGVVVAPTHV